MTTFALAELYDKRNELAGLIHLTEQRVRELRADLAHVEAAIRILRPNEDLPAIVRKRIEYRPRYFKRGQLSRLILDWVRQNGAEPFTVNDILPVAVGERELTHRDQEILRTSIHSVLHKLSQRGIVERVAGKGRTVRWRAAT
jgi:hypothetical protein